MKKSRILWICALLMLTIGMSSCSDDESESQGVNYVDNPKTLDGTWFLVKASYGFGGIKEYAPGEIAISINKSNKTLSVDVQNDEQAREFLKSGTYPYTTAKETRQIFTKDWMNVEYEVMSIQVSDELGSHEVKYDYYFRDGMLFLDGGVAVDGPGYFFKKLK